MEPPFKQPQDVSFPPRNETRAALALRKVKEFLSEPLLPWDLFVDKHVIDDKEAWELLWKEAEHKFKRKDLHKVLFVEARDQFSDFSYLQRLLEMYKGIIDIRTLVNGRTLLTAAASCQNINKTKVILNYIDGLNDEEETKWQMNHWSGDRGNILGYFPQPYFVLAFLERGADPNVPCPCCNMVPLADFYTTHKPNSTSIKALYFSTDLRNAYTLFKTDSGSNYNRNRSSDSMFGRWMLPKLELLALASAKNKSKSRSSSLRKVVSSPDLLPLLAQFLCMSLTT